MGPRSPKGFVTATSACPWDGDPFSELQEAGSTETRPGFRIYLLYPAPPLTSSTDKENPGWCFYSHLTDRPSKAQKEITTYPE